MERPSGTSRHHAVSKHKPRATEVTRGQDLLGCPSWARTRTLLIQSQACCQLHQGAESNSECGTRNVERSTPHSAIPIPHCTVELRGLEPLASWVRSRRSPS